MPKNDDKDYTVDAFHKARAEAKAKDALNNLLIPLMRREIKNPTTDVAGSTEMNFLLLALRGSQAGEFNLKRDRRNDSN